MLYLSGYISFLRLSFPENLQEYKCYQSKTNSSQNGQRCTAHYILYKIIVYHIQCNTTGKGNHPGLIAHPYSPGSVTQKKNQRNHGRNADVSGYNYQRLIKSKYNRQCNGYCKLKSPQRHNAHKYTEANRTCL